MDHSHSSNGKYVSSFRELFVYEKSRELAREIYKTSLTFPPQEKFSLTDQIRRSSRSIGANIAEAWGKREYSAHFISKLSDSLAEAHETQAWLDHAIDCKYLSNDEFIRLNDLSDHVGALIRKTSLKANQFCGKLDRSATDD